MNADEAQIRSAYLFFLSLWFLVPAFAGAVFLFGAAQHGQRALRLQVSAGDDDGVYKGHRRHVRAGE